MDVKLVSVETADGVRLDGVLREPAHRGAGRLGIDAVIFHHGVGGNFYNASYVTAIGDAVLDEGCAVLRVNNRGHDLAYNSPRGRSGAAFETVDDCRHDWRAWLDFTRSLGYERIALWGHSLGAVKTIYYLATEHDPRVVCAVTTSPPRFSHSAYLGEAEAREFTDQLAAAQRLLDQGEGEHLLAVEVPTPLVLTARTYVDKYGPDARYDILAHLPNVPAPLLVTVGSKEDQISFRHLPQQLTDMAAGRPTLTFALIDGADHQYTDRTAELWRAARGWLEQATVSNVPA
jgi:pimeloyl-ACP methyl ester carboxylesterase